jgi:hypothetical protein
MTDDRGENTWPPDGERLARIKFGARIENDGEPIEVKVIGPIETTPARHVAQPPRWNHRSAVIAAWVFLVLIIGLVIAVLAIVTPTLHTAGG